MIGQIMLLCLSFYQTSGDKPSVKFFQDNFIVRIGDKRADVPLQLPKEKPRLSMSFRKNKNYAVWDDRGLTIRIGKVAKSTKLEAIATSPKALDSEELTKTIALIQANKRSRSVSALSGAKRIGTQVFFVGRWEDSDGKPWLEALVSVDLLNPTYHPKFLATLPGSTLADKPIDDRLFMLGSRMTCVIRKDKDWGLARFDEKGGRFIFDPIGTRLQSYVPTNDRMGAFVERTDYKTQLGGRIDLQTLTRKELVEDKSAIQFMDTGEPLIALLKKDSDVRLINTDTGAELNLLSSVSMRRTPLGLVVWSPYSSPKHAWLYSLDRWTVLAEWIKDKD
jgi:hypothetical protein